MEEGGSGIRYLHSCRQDDSIIPIQNRHDGFEGFIFEVRFSNIIEKANGDKALVLNSFRHLSCLPHPAPPEHEKNLIQFFLFLGLLNAKIPHRVKSSVIDEAVNFALSMVEENDAHHNKEEEEEKKNKRKVFPIAVDIVVKNLQRPSESDPEAISRALSESLDDMIGDVEIPPCVDRREFIESLIAKQTALAEKSSPDVPDIGRTNVKEVAATKLSICSLEYTRADDLFCNDECCIICGNGFSCGMVVTCMPCSHPYHGDCLVHLLMRGGSCPRCCELSHCG